VVDKIECFSPDLDIVSVKKLTNAYKMSSTLSIQEATPETLTPRASHVTPPPSPSDNETVVWDSDSDDEYLDADEWFKWFKTTDEYKQMNEVSEVTVLTGSNRF
jgi:hypothetical protein